MKRSLLIFTVAIAMVLSMPAALYASDILVDENGDRVSSAATGNDGWREATVWDLLDDALLTAAATLDDSIVVEEENAEAAAEDGFVNVSVTTSSVNASRHSGTSGTVGAYAGFNQKASSAKCTVILQEKYNGSWRLATGLSITSYIKTVYNSYSISASKTFTLKSGKVYRAKVVFMDTNSTGTYYKTRYTGSF